MTAAMVTKKPVPFKHFKAGNGKIDKRCLVSSLPTYVCFGEGKQCTKCYASRPEKRYPNVVVGREKHYQETLNYNFVELATKELHKAKQKIVRIHESGDFYSQTYVNKWLQIISNCPDKMFYFWTKKDKMFDFTEFLKLPNVNIMVSRTAKGGLNYGSKDYVDKLVRDENFFLCPCQRGIKEVCMNTCFECLTNKKVCFLGH